MSAQTNTEFAFEIETTFCTRPSCVLHVRTGQANVIGAGNWATVNGITVGRRLVDGYMLCDFCAATAASSPP